MLSFAVCILFSLHGMEQPEPQNTNERTYKLPAAKKLEAELRALDFNLFMQETPLISDLAGKELTQTQISDFIEKSWSAYPLNHHPQMKTLMDIRKETLIRFFIKNVIKPKKKIERKLSDTKIDRLQLQLRRYDSF